MKRREEKKTVNQKQAEFYQSFEKNRITRIWYSVRNTLFTDLRKEIGAEAQIYELHKSWLGNLRDKKVLDLGCYAGNSLSYYMAQNSKEYLAIDLSELGINKLQARLNRIPSASARVVDFLSEDFMEKDFDIIYAYGVLHHFKDVDFLITKLKEKLSEEGRIISYDPLQTSFSVKIARSIYRPFQSDKDWEWPFTKEVYLKFQDHFKLIERRGIFGLTKWYFLLNFLPVSEEWKDNLLKKWHLNDYELSKISDKRLFKCMHLTMHLRMK